MFASGTIVRAVSSPSFIRISIPCVIATARASDPAGNSTFPAATSNITGTFVFTFRGNARDGTLVHSFVISSIPLNCGIG